MSSVENAENLIMQAEELRDSVVSSRTMNDNCHEYDVVVDGDIEDPCSYNLVLHAFGDTETNSLFNINADMDTESEYEFKQEAAQISSVLGFVAESERYSFDSTATTLPLSDLESCDTGSVASLDLQDFNVPERLQRALGKFI
jgi:hypothetical protein